MIHSIKFGNLEDILKEKSTFFKYASYIFLYWLLFWHFPNGLLWKFQSKKWLQFNVHAI